MKTLTKLINSQSVNVALLQSLVALLQANIGQLKGFRTYDIIMISVWSILAIINWIRAYDELKSTL